MIPPNNKKHAIALFNSQGVPYRFLSSDNRSYSVVNGVIKISTNNRLGRPFEAPLSDNRNKKGLEILKEWQGWQPN